MQPPWRGPKVREHAISYARNCRTAHRHGEIRVYNAKGELEEAIAFHERLIAVGREAPAQRGD